MIKLLTPSLGLCALLSIPSPAHAYTSPNLNSPLCSNCSLCLYGQNISKSIRISDAIECTSLRLRLKFSHSCIYDKTAWRSIVEQYFHLSLLCKDDDPTWRELCNGELLNTFYTLGKASPYTHGSMNISIDPTFDSVVFEAEVHRETFCDMRDWESIICTAAHFCNDASWVYKLGPIFTNTLGFATPRSGIHGTIQVFTNCI